MRRIIVFSIIVCMSAFAAAQSSSPDALYERGIDAITRVGSTSNDADGIDYFRRSAGLGFGPSQIVLGYYYETGTVLTKDPAQALDLYRKAASVGDPLAGWLAGRLYFLGSGVPRDLDAAQKYLKIAADKNNAFGAYYLGRLMADRDKAKSPALYKIAAEQGLPQAQYYYGKVLKEGSGISQNRSEAYVWLYVAADAGYVAAGTELNDLDGAGSLTQDQIAEARNKARDMEQFVIRAVSARGCEGWDGEFDEFPTPPPPKLQRFCH
jgi:uncharacterized protein